MTNTVPLLKPVTTIAVPGITRFTSNRLVLREANVKCWDNSFGRLFLNKLEENVPKARLAISHLQRNSPDAPILAELGDKAEVSLFYLIHLLKEQKNGEDGRLLVNEYGNNFFVRGIDKELWTVNVHWYSHYGYWYVHVPLDNDPREWCLGLRVFSRA